jgi:cell division protease FtsH
MDIKMASDIARKMICAYGMSEVFGFQSFGDNQELLFLGREVSRSQSYSEDTARKIDGEVERLVNEAYDRASRMIAENRAKLETLVENLLEAETMDGRWVEELVKEGHVPGEAGRAERKGVSEAAKGGAADGQAPDGTAVSDASPSSAGGPEDAAPSPPGLS